MSGNRIGIIGLGQMGLSIATGALKARPDLEIVGYDRMGGKEPGFPVLASPQEVESRSEIILLAVKPGDMKSLCQSLSGEKKYISVAAGLSIQTISDYFSGSKPPILARVMPNISATIGQAVSGVYSEDPDLLKFTTDFFSLTGLAVPLPKEDLMHAVTGLSGSGPAFVFSFIHALAEGGLLAGLPFADALQLAAHTVKGAAEMVIQSGNHPGELRNRVTSPAGTTIQGLSTLEEGGFHGLVMGAVTSAARRSRELGEKK